MWWIITVAALLLMNAALWLFFMPWYVNRRIAGFQNELVTRHYNEVETMYRKMRGWRHDYHNHIQVLKAHMDLQQYEQAEKYLDMLETDLTTVDTVIKTGNVAVDAILNSKLNLIREKKITVDATALVNEKVDISGVELSSLIGNLLDNAMEACMKVPEEERFIRIYMDIVKKQLYISVTNAMEGRAKKIGGVFRSQKAGNHGFGILRIDSIVHRYNGYINRQSEAGVFATEIMLPLVR